MKTTQLRNRIVTYFVSIVMLLSLLFSLINLMFSYVVEDSFFYQILDSEKQQIALKLQQGETPKPHFNFISYHSDRESLPADVKTLLLKEPKRKEFSDEQGKHYHIAYLNDQKPDQNILLAEVSEHLVVKELTGLMFGFSSAVLAVGIIIAVLLAFGTVRMAKKLLKPLDDLMEIVNNSPVETLPTDFSTKFKQDEIGKFAQTLEKALKRISAFIKREQQFTRDISHELRTPLTISQGALSLLNHTELNDRQKELITRISDADQQMQSTIEALLTLAREKSGKPQHTNLKSTIEACIISNHTLLAQTSLHLSVPDNVSVTMGSQELRLVIQNLLQNAVHHGQGDQININYDNKTLVITDNGQGLPEVLEVSKAFETGHRGPHSNGTGIGLSLVKRLCEKYEVQVELITNVQGVSVCLMFE